MWVKDVEFGRPTLAGAFALVFRITEGVAFLVRVELFATLVPLELRRLWDAPDAYLAVGFGVVLESPEGSFNLLLGAFIGVFTICAEEASEIGGEGGVRVSIGSAVETDAASGGVVIIGDETVEVGEMSNAGEFGAVMSVVIVGNWRLRNLSCMISASILRSDNSSRRR